MMPLVVLLLVVGLVCYLVPIEERFKQLVYVICVVLVVLWLLSLVGLNVHEYYWPKG